MSAFQTNLIVGGRGSRIGSTITVGRRDTRPAPSPAEEAVDVKEPIPVTIWFHELRTSDQSVLVSIASSIKAGQVFELVLPEKSRRLYITMSEEKRDKKREKRDKGDSKDDELLRGQVSLHSPLQKALDVQPRSTAHLRLVTDLDAIEAESVEIYTKDINLSRDSQWRLSQTLVGTCLHLEERVVYLSNRTGVVRHLYRNKRAVFSAYVGPNTKFVFRSESAKLTVLLQLSSEMWYFEENGEIMFHKLVNNLFPKMLKRWRSNNVHHSITVVLFTSVDLTNTPWITLAPGERPHNRRDYFRVVVDQVNISSWDKIMANLRLEFANFKRDIMLKMDENNKYTAEGDTLPAVKGNILEAVSLALSVVSNRFQNIDLKYYLNHFMVVTAGTGIFDTDYELMLETSRRFAAIDCGLDIISLSQPPLHIVPLFRAIDSQGKLTHCVPNWCDISFYKETHNSHWTSRCKMYELQMMGVMENEADEVRIDRLHLSNKAVLDAMDAYDANVFRAKKKKDYFGDYERPTREPSPVSSVCIPSSIPPLAAVSALYTSTSALLGSAVAHVSANTTTGTVSSNHADSALSSLYVLNRADERVSSGASIWSGRSISAKPSMTTLREREKENKKEKEKEKEHKKEKGNKNLSSPIGDVLFSPLLDKHLVKYLDRPTHTRQSEKIVSTNRFWTEIENPSQEIQADLVARVSRWSDLFADRRRLIKWRSFQAPAALPVTTSCFPSPQELETDYTFQIYNVLLNYENYLELNTTHELMREMIQLRLNLGFQICCSDRVHQLDNERHSVGAVDSLVKYFPQSSLGSHIYMSFDDEIHRIACDVSGNLSVQLYRKKKSASVPVPTSTPFAREPPGEYTPLIRTRYADDYCAAQVSNPTQQRFNWNQLDQFLAGYEDALPEGSQDFYKMKFVVMPSEVPKNGFYINNEQLSDEEIRVEGLRKLIALVEKGRFVNHKKPKPEAPMQEIVFYTGNLYDFLNEEAENYDITGNKPSLMVPENARFNKSTKLAELAAELQGPSGIAVADRTWHFKRHRNAFLGSELVLWLYESFEDLSSREDACDYGQSLMDRGLFRHVERRHRLLDGYYFYTIEDEYVDEEQRKRRKENERHMSRRKNASLKKVDSNPSSDESLGESELSSLAKRRKFILSRAVKFNVDPLGKSFRPELVTVHYDVVHNTEHCYHIRFEWLNTSAKLIDETVINWSRLCERHGLNLVETPWQELCTIPRVNPFHSFVDLKLSVNPWTDTEFNDPALLRENKYFYHLHLLKHAKFYLDNRASSFFSRDNVEISYSWGKPSFTNIQYIHESGLYFVELRNNGDFFMAPNNLHIKRSNTTIFSVSEESPPKGLMDSQRIMLDFRLICHDEEMLRGIFREGKRVWRENETRQAELDNESSEAR